MKTYIGLVGEKLSGKETFTKALREFMGPDVIIEKLRFSDIIADMLDILGLPKTRENMQKLPILLMGGFGADVITNAMKIRLEKSNANIIVLDGIRRFTDAKMLRKLPSSFLIYITASPEVRFQRVKSRNEKIGESSISLERFLEQEKAEIEREIPLIGKTADYTIENNSSLAEFKEKVRKTLSKKIN